MPISLSPSALSISQPSPPSPSSSPPFQAAAARLAARLAYAPGTWGSDEPPPSLTVDTVWPAPPLCCGPGPPPLALVPTLPFGEDDPNPFYGAAAPPGPAAPWRVVELEPGACTPADTALAAALRSRRAPVPLSGAAAGRPGARGGGGGATAAAAREAGTATAAAAAAAARTGAWLKEYEATTGAAHPPRVPVPGGGPGLFGAWQEKEEGDGGGAPRPPPPPPPLPPAADLLFGGGWADGVGEDASPSTSASDDDEDAAGGADAAAAPPPAADPSVAAATDAALAARPPRPAHPPPRPPPSANPYARWARRAPAADLAARFAALAPHAALAFKHPLDAFQKEAIALLEGGSSVFVAAHTGAGKTAVAEYAAALAASHGCRCFYTAPIKTISNQKFRDFTARGLDTGLVTGDVSIKPDAATVVMTTEVLRSMLYRGDDGLADVETVVFDEVRMPDFFAPPARRRGAVFAGGRRRRRRRESGGRKESVPGALRASLSTPPF